MIEEQLQFIVDEDGDQTSVIISIEMFHSMLHTIEELEEHYFAHHPEEREIRDAELKALEQEQ